MANSNPSNRRSTANGIVYTLLEGYPKFVFERGETKVSEVYKIATSDLPAFITESFPAPSLLFGSVVIPNPRTVPGSTIIYTKQVKAEPWLPDKPFDPFLVDSAAPSGTYDDWCRVTIEYSTDVTDGDGSNDTLFEHSVSAGAEFLTIPPQKASLEDKAVEDRVVSEDETATVVAPGQEQPNTATAEANKDAALGITMTIPTIEHNFRYKYVMFPNWELFANMLGTVNTNKPQVAGAAIDYTAATSPHIGIPTAKQETVMFMGVSGSQRVVYENKTTVIKPWEIDLKFSQRSYTKKLAAGIRTYGWNHTYAPQKGRWVRVFTGDGKPVHRRTNHNQLFLNTGLDGGDDDGGGL